MLRAFAHPAEDVRSAAVAPRSPNLWSLLFRPREPHAFSRTDWLVLALYSAVLAVTIPFHEQWADEAQAWLIARDSSLWDIFYRRLHYEGTPGLWHLILWFATRLHLPYASLNWISALCAIGGIYVFLRYAPFPNVLRYLLPFTFWLQYQYAVTARSYSLIPLLVFGLCAIFADRRPRPLLFAVLAGLLANLSLYSALWAGALVLIYLGVLWTRHRQGVAIPRLASAASALCALFLIAVYTALPAPDLLIRGDGAAVFNHRSHLRDVLIPPTPAPPGWENSSKVTLKFPEAEPDTTLYTRGNALQRAAIRILHPPGGSYTTQTWGHRLTRWIIPFNALFFGISRSNVLGACFLLACLIWFAARHAFRLLVPLGLMLFLGCMTWINDHHAGLLFLSIVAALWISWPRHEPETRGLLRIHRALVAVFLLVALEQAGWSAAAVAADIRYPFDPGKATAAFIKEHGAGKKVAGLTYETISTVPYLPGNPFLNQPTTYWMYNRNFVYWKRLPEIYAIRPDFFIIGAQYVPPDNLANQLVPEFPPGKANYAINPLTMNEHGYHEQTRFCGRIFLRGNSGTMYCNIVFVPGTAAH